MESQYMTIGADPELMLLSPEGKLVSAIPLIKGTKEEPTPVAKGAIQSDNVMSEFNVDPSGTSEEFLGNIRTVLSELGLAVRPNRLLARAYAEYSEEELDHPKARRFGCDPDYCAWPDKYGLLNMNVVPGHLAFEPFRSCGGHIHVGYKEGTRELLTNPHKKVEIVQLMDVLLGIPSVILDRSPSSKARRILYGQAGAHRWDKEYGLEYRVLGNFWVADPALAELVYELTDQAVRLALEEETVGVVETVGQKTVQEIINRSRPRLAKRAVEEVISRYLSKELTEKILTYPPKPFAEDKDLEKTWRIR